MAEQVMQRLKDELFQNLLDKFDLLATLENENDWGFVIKSHAMIEAATTEMIVNFLGNTNLTKVIERLPLSDSQYGKLAIAKSLNLLSDNERNFARSYSELRNQLVHKVENLNFNFGSYFQNMTKDKRNSWINTVCWFCLDDKTRRAWKQIATKFPRQALFMAMFEYLSMCLVAQSGVKGEREINLASELTMKSLLKPNA